RLKEWAYAGAFLTYSGAITSHLVVGDGPDKWAAPLLFAGLTGASWALRPASRSELITGPSSASRGRTLAYWIRVSLRPSASWAESWEGSRCLPSSESSDTSAIRLIS